MSAPTSAASASTASAAPRFLRIGELDGGEAGIGGELGVHHVHVVEARGVQRRDGGLAADAVQRCERDAQGARRAAR